MKADRNRVPAAATPKKKRKNKLVSLQFDPVSRDVVAAAAGLTILTFTDFVRLALRLALAELPTLCYQAAAVRAQKLFIKKAEKEFGLPFTVINFEKLTVRQWVHDIELDDNDWTSPKSGNVAVNIKGDFGYPGAFENKKRDEYPEAFETLDKYLEAFRNPPDGPDFESYQVIRAAVNVETDSEGRQPYIEKAKEEIRNQIRNEFGKLKIKFQALPGLYVEAKKLGASPSFIRKYRNDPHTLQTYISWRAAIKDTSPHSEDDWQLWG